MNIKHSKCKQIMELRYEHEGYEVYDCPKCEETVEIYPEDSQEMDYSIWVKIQELIKAINKVNKEKE